MRVRKQHGIMATLFALQVLLSNLHGQNLVYNGDFEIADTCPTNLSQIQRAAGWIAIGGTPDYNNSCNTNNFNVPRAHMGYQADCCGGSGIAGEYMMVSINTPGDDMGREYMGTKLLDTLKSGHKYLVSMYLNRANFNYSIASVGMLFTDTLVIISNPQQSGPLPVNPQVKNNVVITDTLSWFLLQDTIVAIGNEAFLTIGNFNTTSTSDTISEPPSSGLGAGAAYYYIDGVSVYDLATLGLTQFGIEKKFKVYPDPASDLVSVEGNEINEVKIFDALGREQLRTKEKEIVVKNLPEGIYFVCIQAPQGIVAKKIIIQH